ncbi:MAG: type II toxin-antitoxin system VapC family toxin [Candidatus Promineifilaceae bacterium]
MKILDSDHCIAILRGRLNLEDWVSPTDVLAVTAVNVAELMHGAHKSQHAARNIAQVDVLLAAMEILPFDEQAARHFGRLKADLERAGMPLAIADLQIAAVALHHQVPVVTHNYRHFSRIPTLEIEDWLV